MTGETKGQRGGDAARERGAPPFSLFLWLITVIQSRHALTRPTMDIATPEELSKVLLTHVASPRNALFAGAGTSARLGVSTWDVLLRNLASVCAEFGDTTSASLIEAKIQEQDLLGAASVYNLCKRIPVGEKLKRLTILLSPAMGDAELEKLRSLMEVGFSAMVTTNFDRVLHHAYSFVYRRSPLNLELDDDSLRAGAGLSEFFIARIHGRVEHPESIVFDEFSYAGIEKNQRYLDFLINVLTQRSCCFVGFSFRDPAIARVVGIFKEKFGASKFPELHLAILPNSAPEDLVQLLGSANIRVLFYDAQDGHRNLWHAFRLAAEAKKLGKIQAAGDDIPLKQNITLFKRLTAFSFAQLTTRDVQAPLLDSTSRAIILSVIENGNAKGRDDAVCHAETAALLHVSTDTAKKIFVEITSELIAAGSVERKNGNLVLRQKQPSSIDERLASLGKAIVDRVRVFTGLRLSPGDVEGVSRIVEKVFLARAWDLAAYYAGSKIGYPTDVTATIEQILAEEASKKRITAVRAISLGLNDLLHRPTDVEASTLADIGRAAFAVQLMLSAPRQSAFARYVLPTKIYFDSSVIMPAIVDGHPMQPLYWQAIQSISDASAKSKLPLELLVPYQFANEIVSHRDLAIRIINELGLEDPKTLRQFSAIYGAHNGNVFVGAYSLQVGRAERPITFREFLSKVAPYTNERELEEYLRGRGFTIAIQDPSKIENFEKTKTLLLNGYARGQLWATNKKDDVLVHHEAAQVATLIRELENGEHSVFVTADLRLTNVIYTDSYLKRASGAIMTHWGFIGLVDLLIGAKIDSQSFARLVWGCPAMADDIRIRDFLLQRAISAYDESLLRRMPEVLEESVKMGKEEVQRRGIKLGESGDVAELTKARDAMDRVENYFFERMREAMDKAESQERGSSQKV